MRVIRNNPFIFDTKDKPFGIVGRSSSIIKVIGLLDTVIEKNYMTIFVVGGKDTGKSSILKLIERLSSDYLGDDKIEFYHKKLELNLIEFLFNSYIVDIHGISTIKQLIKIIDEKENKKTFFPNIKKIKTTLRKITPVGSVEVEGEVEMEKSSRENYTNQKNLYDKLERVIDKSRHGFLLMLDNCLDFFNSKEDVNCLEKVINDLRFKGKSNFALIVSCTNREYEIIKDVIDNEVIYIDEINAEEVKVNIAELFKEANIEISSTLINGIVDRFGLNIDIIYKFCKEIADRDISEVNTTTIKICYDEVLNRYKDKYAKDIKLLDYNYKNLINYIKDHNEGRSIEHISRKLSLDKETTKILCFKLMDLGIIDINKKTNIVNFKSMFIKDCLENM